MATPLDRMLHRWQQAGLIDPDQRRRIAEFESSSNATARLADARSEPPPDLVERPSGTELLAYLGVLVALAGVLTLVYASGATITLVAGLTLALGLLALVATREFTGRGGAPAARAAGACLALAVVALGVAAGEFAAAASLFTTTVTTDLSCGATPCPSITTRDDSGDALFGAVVAVVFALALIRLVPGRLVAVVAIASAYAGAAELSGVLQLQNETGAAGIAVILVVVSAALVAFGETLRRRQPETFGFFGFAGVLGATVPLYGLGGGSNTELDVIGGIIAAGSLGAGIVLPRPGIAYGAVIGLAGLVIDIGARNFHSPTSLGVFFSVCGVVAVAALVAITRLLRSSASPEAGRLRE